MTATIAIGGTTVLFVAAMPPRRRACGQRTAARRPTPPLAAEPGAVERCAPMGSIELAAH